jgi:hypothetical protein
MDRSGVLVVLAAALALSGSAGAAAGDGLGSLQSGDVETDAVVLQAAVDGEGNAAWTINYRVRLDDENTSAAFESLQADIRNNTSDYRGQFAARMQKTVAAAENATGREMRLSNVTVSTRTTLDGQYGVISYGFRWEGFAATDGDRIRVGDALAGLFLDADTKLVFSWPERFELQRVDPQPDSRDDRSVTWEGPVDFGTDQPRLLIEAPGGFPAWTPVVAVGLVALGGGLWYYRRQSLTGGGEPEQPAGPAAAEGGESRRAPADTDEPSETGMEPTAGGDATEQGPGAGEPAATSGTREELLSPEERVLGLLEQHGGRMKQKAVTEELDWSAARTSQVVSDLRDAGEVESFRLGRENVLKFPEEGDDRGGMP